MLDFRQVACVFMVGGLVATVLSPYWARAEENGERRPFDVAAFEPLTEAHARLIQRLHDDTQTELLRKLGVETDKEERWVKRFGEKTPVFYARYKTKTGDSRVALVYDAALHRWPGTQPQTIVLADDQYRLIAWKEVGGTPFFESARLTTVDPRGPVLVITRRHRHVMENPERGDYRVLLVDDRIQELPEVEWIYASQAERERFDRIRQDLRNREKRAGEGVSGPGNVKR